MISGRDGTVAFFITTSKMHKVCT